MLSYLTDPKQFAEKERLYLEVRRKEGRVLTDEEVKLLPHTTANNPAHQEWEMRRRSFERLQQYLSKKHGTTPIKILDLGCGNGWMSNRLAENPTFQVTGIDLNLIELQQGVRLFTRKNLGFAYANILDNVIPESTYDVIILAASLQYFPQMNHIINSLFRVLTPDGEIHIIDSPFYKDSATRDQAALRTLSYYRSKGVEGMASYYHHHPIANLYPFDYTDLNRGFWNKILKKIGILPPFPWIRIRKHI